MFHQMYMASVFVVLSFSGLVLSREHEGLCFLVGEQTLPADVKPDPNVRCVPSSRAFDSLETLPDVEFGKDDFLVRFTSISYLKDSRVSAVRFAMNHFPITMDKQYIINAMTVYGAINAGLRSLGERPSGKYLGPLKGVSFFLGFQLRCKEGNIFGLRGAKHQLLKVLKNCVHCTDADRDDMKKLGAKFGITGI
ncbi:hypothetical protein DFH28DRAFT_306061 [Melampsora americana]|nr:hypothetical protein DFH28DRAFT_306061 [Melampsora americana]